VIVDVSNNNGRVDWDQAARHVEGAMGKASEGVTFRDGYFQANRAACKQRELLFGGYHYGRVGSPLTGQLETFLGMLDGGPRGGELPAALDIEWEGNRGQEPERVRWFVLEFLSRLEELTDAVPMLYSASAYLTETGLDRVEELGRFPLWLASWRETVPRAPWPWHEVTLWQYTSRGSVPGITGAVDCNRLLVPRERIVVAGALPGPTPPPAWFKPWARWRRARPAAAPERIPGWAWRRLRELLR